MSKQDVIWMVAYWLDVLEEDVLRFLDTESLMDRRSRVDAILDLISQCDNIIGLIKCSVVEVSENADLEFYRKSAHRWKRRLEGWLDEIQSTFNYDEGGGNKPKGGDNKPKGGNNKPAEPRPSDSGNGANPDPSAPKGGNNKSAKDRDLADEIASLTQEILGGLEEQNGALKAHQEGVLAVAHQDGELARPTVRDNADRVIESLSVSGSGLMLAAVLAVVAFVATLLLTGGSTTIFSDRLYKAVVWAILAFAGSALIASFLPRATGKGHNNSAAKRHGENK